MKNIYSLLFILTFSVEVLALEAPAENAISLIELVDIVDRNANKMLQQPYINSLSVAIIYQGLAHTAHFGELTKGENDTPDNDTIYEIGSGSKTFIGALVAEAVLDRKLSLDDNASKYMGSGFSGFGVNSAPVTVRHLLTHTAGLPNMLPLEATSLLENFTDKKTPELLNSVIKAYNREQFLDDLQTLTLGSPPGEAHSYSSAGTEVLAHILEQVYDQEYEAILDGFTARLKMNDTGISLGEQQRSKLAIGYHLDNLDPAPPTSTALRGAAGNMKSTAADMLSYLRFQLDKENAIARASHKVLYQSSNGERIAYKWNLSDEGFFGDALHHHGGVSRAQNYILVAPKRNFGLFVITNQSGTSTPKVLLGALNGIMADIERNQVK